MRRSGIVALVGLSVVVMAAPAAAAPTRYLYMTKDVESVDGVYIGDFVVLAKKGSKVVGALGAFSSEYVCVSGTVKNGRLRATIYDNGQAVGSFNRKWVGSGSTQRIKGMTRASKAEVTTYLGGGDPKTFIKDCRSVVAN